VGAFITQTAQGPVVVFLIGAYPGWGSAFMNMGYPNPGLAVVKPTTSTVNPASTLPCTVPTTSSLSSLTDTASATTTTSNVTDSASSKLITLLKILALAPRPLGVETYPPVQALPVPVAATSMVQPSTEMAPATVQQPGSTTTITTAAPASTAATAAVTIVPPASTTAMTSAVVTALPISTSTCA